MEYEKRRSREWSDTDWHGRDSASGAMGWKEREKEKGERDAMHAELSATAMQCIVWRAPTWPVEVVCRDEG